MTGRLTSPPYARYNVGVDEAELMRAIRAKVELGHLPRKPPAKVFAGPGTGQLCEVCSRPTEPNTTEYEIDVEARSIRMHRACYEAWTRELGKTA